MICKGTKFFETSKHFHQLLSEDLQVKDKLTYSINLIGNLGEFFKALTRQDKTGILEKLERFRSGAHNRGILEPFVGGD